MNESGKAQPLADAAAVEAWERSAPWHRRVLARIGLQWKLVLGFVLMLAVTHWGNYLVFGSKSRELLLEVLDQQAVEMATALSMASRTAMDAGDAGELKRMGSDVMRGSHVLAVSFLDPSGTPIALACPDAELWRKESAPNPVPGDMQAILEVRRRNSPTYGQYVEAAAPVFRYFTTPGLSTATTRPARLLGYVVVSTSAAEQLRGLGEIHYLLAVLLAVVIGASVPLVYVLVRRIFVPIRELVGATNRMADGDMNATVAVHRPDMIGMLARSFNVMVRRVRQQQEDLATANRRLAEINRGLEANVEQRTAQLEAANKRLSSEIAEKEDFLRAVTHDLNAPLRNIAGMAAMLLAKHREGFDTEVVHRLERIQKNVEAETSLISELLELSRIKTRRRKMEAVDVGGLVADLAELFESDLRDRGIGLLIDGALPTLVCEKARLRQVFQNLIDNAIKYMGDGPRREIHVGCAVRPSEVEFYVRDTGTGIDPEDLGKVFFVFRRGKNVAQNVAGKGVGLASVKSIIETYSGTIWVESRLGAGSTFRFTINGKYLAGSGAGENAGRERAGGPERVREVTVG